MPPSSPLLHHEKATEKLSVHLQQWQYLHMFVYSTFPALYQLDSEMKFGVIYLAIWGSTNAMSHFGHLDSLLVASFIAEHARHPSLFPSKSHYLSYLMSSLFSWLMDETCLSSLVVSSSRHPSCLLDYVSHQRQPV
jgi:hypothetical protein